MRFATLLTCLSATAALAAPARMDKQTKRQALNPTDLLNQITSELTSTTSGIQDIVPQLTDALGLGSVTGGVTGGASAGGSANAGLGGLLGGLLGGGAHGGTSQSVDLGEVSSLLDDIVGQVTELQGTLEGLTGTTTTVGGDVASGDAADALAALVAEVQSVVGILTQAASSGVPGLGDITGGFEGQVNDPLSAITGLLTNLIPGLLEAVQTLLTSLLSGLTGGSGSGSGGAGDLLSGLTSILNLRRRLML